jgi:hypothetical protein
VTAARALPFLWLLAACSAPPPPPSRTPEPAPPLAPEVTPARAESGAWLAWRQDVGGVVRTALIEQADPAAPPRVTKATRLLLAGTADGGGFRLWDIGPATTRWAVSPCGEHALAFAKGLRVSSADGGGAGGRLDVSDPSLRPASGANAVHREFVVFAGQAEGALRVRHVTRSGPCPLGEGARAVTELSVDLASGVIASAARATSGDKRAPGAVEAFWAELARLDEGREVEPDEVGLYGGVGWGPVPADAIPRVRALIEAARDAPTPSGPTDWD